MTDHWKTYPPIPAVVTFDADNAGPTTASLQVIANTSTSQNYPASRIGVLVNGLGSVCITVEQCLLLEEHLAAARRAVRAGESTQPVAALGSEGRCESCSQAVEAGEEIAVHDKGTEDEVVVHAGICPAERVH